MLGGLGICGRPYCCSQFMDEFEPVSTKMAKVQNLSLNPTKISGSCGRLMCCLRYEQEAYEDLIKKMPKLGTFVETPAGYGTVAQVNLLREQIKVKLDGDGDDVFRVYEAEAVAAVPGGRPKDGETPPSVLKYVPKPKQEEVQESDSWTAPEMFAQSMSSETPETADRQAESSGWDEKQPQGDRKPGSRRHRGSRSRPAQEGRPPRPESPKTLTVKPEKAESKPRQPGKNYHRRSRKPRPKPGGEAPKT
jgi:hypothetical protein